MTYTTPLKSKLGLNVDDVKQEGKLKRLLEDLNEKINQPAPGDIAWHYTEEDLLPAAALKADWQQWPSFSQRTVWSKSQGHTWFAAEITVPEEAANQTFFLRFTSQWTERPGSTDPQCLAYLDGEIVQAIDGNHNELVIMRDAKPGTKHMLHVDAFTFFDRPLAGFKVEYFIRHADVESLYFDLHTPYEVACRLHQTDPRRHTLFNLVDRALRSLDRRGPEYSAALKESIAEAKAIADEIYALQDTEVQPTITAFGHTHVDIAWLWRVLHTREKGGRSFATALNMMEEYPSYLFMYNQAVLYHFIKQDYPVLWQGIKEAVRRGQLEIEGAMWVEPDANIVSGESMVRQIMMGRTFHQTEFGVTPSCVWLPDTFGYSANMPQILDKSGLGYFLTSKLSWNDTDQHPFDTFFWRGIDGTDTKAHLITAQRFESEAIYTTYNSDMSVSEVMGSWKRYEPKAVHDELVLCYGYGDGGGGPTREMVERGMRLERGIPGAPNVRLEGLKPFLDRLGAKMDGDADRFPRWNGELYLEYHRGTLTTIGKTKRNNRLAERKMRELEWMASMAAVETGASYPFEALDQMWKVVLINQFHDILPGTSIREVYEDTEADYDKLFADLAAEEGPFFSAEKALRQDGSGARVYNFTCLDRDGDLLALPEGMEATAIQSGGTSEPLQILIKADGSRVQAAPVHAVGSHGWAGVALAEATPKETRLKVSKACLENDLVAVAFNDKGEITSVFDKRFQRELLAAGKVANQLVAYEDKSMEWDAWDIDWYFEEQSWPFGETADVTVVETGPHRAALRIERSYQSSKIVQIVSLADNSAMVEFDTSLDWHETRTVLKAIFPFDMNVSEIRSEIQFGHVKRATHRNTSWDKARFEASMHRWVDMSEADFGAALLNDCKYAYDAFEQTVRLTLVRGSIFPFEAADQGLHDIRYALLVHEGVKDLASVHHAAERFNNPLQVIGALKDTCEEDFSLVAASAENVTIETVKIAEAGNGLVLRLFEHANRRASTDITFGIPVKSVRIVNLMEEKPSEPLTLSNNAVTVSFRPFELVTLLVECA
ncbi:alpha-mannosidase [Cohaesibacter sp. ES.047]|uniref:alpha-mannosidase n=1 Tax=Cohaesibacter sp. ES.047 TaxID=1798205 RepID=UPI000BB68E1E|nr:glycoside hydrolase family 38 C-terminal domain-containing protein [Cohaesibacter sp. ES.047]SNY92210.1 alpha-mannosidase [Cohaesibacter sp. ES.047]